MAQAAIETDLEERKTYQLPDPTMVTLCFFECPPKLAMLPNVAEE
jgi:hypothetical protein